MKNILLGLIVVLGLLAAFEIAVNQDATLNTSDNAFIGSEPREIVGQASAPVGGQVAQPSSAPPSPPNPPTGSSSTTYFYGKGLVASAKGSVLTYHHQDYLSSNRFSTNAQGQLQSRSVSYPYGKTLDEGSFAGTVPKYTFTGKEDDGKLMYFGARYYHPGIARFTSVDPIGGSGSPYEYANDNPLKFIDPDGKQAGIALRQTTEGATSFGGAWDRYRNAPESLAPEHARLIERIQRKMTNNPDLQNAMNYNSRDFRDGLVILPSALINPRSDTIPIVERSFFHEFSSFKQYVYNQGVPSMGEDWHTVISVYGATRIAAEGSRHDFGQGIDMRLEYLNEKTGQSIIVSEHDVSAGVSVLKMIDGYNKEFDGHLRSYALDGYEKSTFWWLHVDLNPQLSLTGSERPPLNDRYEFLDSTDTVPRSDSYGSSRDDPVA